MPPDRVPDAQAGFQYWNDIAADENGMLGGLPSQPGFESISRIDLQGSRTFLARLGIGTKHDRNRVGSALDAGAGIGRISKGLLVKVADEVDIVEPIAKFTKAIRGHAGIRTISNVALQDWQPGTARYDIIWTQWCLGHLTDQQVVLYLRTCREALTPDGLVVVKENLSTSGSDDFDETDSSVTRQDSKWKSLFHRAGLAVVRTDEQRGFPETPGQRLLPVQMYALRPAEEPLAFE
ncbi:uncharacterized protein UV8b_00038 [Ustilaginoidea virens]|uniref:Alpha N-terminal protein methyltransferase 1 n=1 Tax=Ustilaginoidea virens TaxID=1159556 RepID=A0A063BTU2_USTVR|nr:uncharacterized protein UV8b_00038 [Ustilaginoidea virens]QUC15797.1 hypothetical protein UV8b_00038 [Ustilaginoidea virens]GAO18702.1 hypothetical protein UVI_02053080 [Ustilaginoidea virens]